MGIALNFQREDAESQRRLRFRTKIGMYPENLCVLPIRQAQLLSYLNLYEKMIGSLGIGVASRQM